MVASPVASSAVLVGALAAAVSAATAAAQGGAGSALPGRRFDPPPPAAPAPEPAPEPAAAVPAVAAPSTPAPGGPGFVLRGVRVETMGPPSVDPQTLAALAAPLIGRTVDAAALEVLRRAMTEAVVAQGFVNSGVLLPDQDVAGGEVVFMLVGGRLVETRLSGTGLSDAGAGLGRLDAEHLRRLVAVDPDAAFSLTALQERLRAALRERDIVRLDAAVRPGDRLGEAILDLDVETRRPFDLGFTLDNATRPELGELTAGVAGAARNLIGRGDELRGSLRLSRGVREALVDADMPLWPGGPSVFVVLEAAEARIVSDPLAPLEIESRFLRAGVGISAAVIDEDRRSLRLGLAFDAKATRSTLLGEPFSFSPGVVDGESRLAVLSADQIWIERGERATLALRSAFRLGLPALGATEGEGGAPDALFLAWVGQAQAVTRPVEGLDLLARAQVQLASNALLPAEQVALGGAATVRGYREGALIGDEALAATLEARLAVLDLSVSGLTPAGHDASLSLRPFVDFGATWDKGRRGDLRDALGVGAALVWSPTPALSASVTWASALRDVDAPAGDGGLQDHGVHFALSFMFP